MDMLLDTCTVFKFLTFFHRNTQKLLEAKSGLWGVYEELSISRFKAIIAGFRSQHVSCFACYSNAPCVIYSVIQDRVWAFPEICTAFRHLKTSAARDLSSESLGFWTLSVAWNSNPTEYVSPSVHLKMETDSVSEILSFPSYLEFWTMGKDKKPSDSEWYRPLS
jgi:hypothetical protein